MLSKSVERAQKKVEENNFGIRKRLLEYDDVMNSQRELIYKRRRHALMGERIENDVAAMISETARNIVEMSDDDYQGMKMDLLRVMALDIPFVEADMKKLKSEEMVEAVTRKAFETFKRKTERLAEVAHPVIRQVYENQGAMYQNILIPITDGKKVYNVSCNLKEAYDSGSKVLVKAFEKAILLHTIDEDWKEHLREMDELRHSVQNASYEQKDPLLIYKLESFNLFRTMVSNVNSKAVSVLMRGQIPIQDPSGVKQAAPEKKTDYSKYRTQKDESGNMAAASEGGGKAQPRQPQKLAPIRVEKKVGRNDPCPCGSGKKYKNCHGRE
jgi:preprotein translocase subunit SecA